MKTNWLCVKSQERRRFPKHLDGALKKARSEAGNNKLGIVVLHDLDPLDDLVLLSLKDFKRWFGDLQRKGPE